VIVLYLETNFLVGCATGRDRVGPDRLASPLLRSAIPGVCFLEAFSWMEGENKRRNAFDRTLKEQLTQLKRDLTSPSAKTLTSLLEAAIAENEKLTKHINDRLTDAVVRVSDCSEILPLSLSILEANRRDLLIDELTDNLIAHCILEHARTEGSPKAFFSENYRDFDGAAGQEALRSASVLYFRDADQLFEWATAHDGPQAEIE